MLQVEPGRPHIPMPSPPPLGLTPPLKLKRGNHVLCASVSVVSGALQGAGPPAGSPVARVSGQSCAWGSQMSARPRREDGPDTGPNF